MLVSEESRRSLRFFFLVKGEIHKIHGLEYILRSFTRRKINQKNYDDDETLLRYTDIC
jgi:hypothetical protein